jgi:hypothetical protein
VEIVGRDQGNASTIGLELSALNFCQQERCAFFIKVARWLIQQDEFRVTKKGASDTHPRLHPFREFTKGTIHDLRKLKPLNNCF